MDNKRVNNRFKLQKKKKNNFLKLFFLFLFILIIFKFFSYKEDIINKTSLNWNTIIETESLSNKIEKIEKNTKVETEDFQLIFTWTVVDKSWLEHDFDLDNIDLTWSTLEIEFSTNNEFKSYPVLSAANLGNIRYWFMLWKLRNRNNVFWVWKNTDSIKKNKYNLIELEEDWKIEFKAANLNGWILFVRITIKWRRFK